MPTTEVTWAWARVRYPQLVSRLVLVDANLDPTPPSPGSAGSSGIAAYSEEEFLAGGWQEIRDRAGSHWWSTMRLAGREALHRSAVHLARGTTPTMREYLLDLKIPRTYLLPEADGPLPGADALIGAGGVRGPGPGLRAQHHAGQPGRLRPRHRGGALGPRSGGAPPELPVVSRHR